MTTCCSEPPVKTEDREDALLLPELLRVRSAVPGVAREIAAVRHVLHTGEDIQRLSPDHERAVDADVETVVVRRPLAVDAREVVHAAALRARRGLVVRRERAAREKR